MASSNINSRRGLEKSTETLVKPCANICREELIRVILWLN
jgi:hypothetical protein